MENFYGNVESVARQPQTQQTVENENFESGEESLKPPPKSSSKKGAKTKALKKSVKKGYAK